jgi:hypothetical protein
MAVRAGEVVVRFGAPLRVEEGETPVAISNRVHAALDALLAAKPSLAS